MTFKYYFINIGWGVFFALISFYFWYEKPDEANNLEILIVSIISLLFYPLSKKLIEDIALKFSTREFWNQGFFMETCGKSGAYAMYYLFCFVFAIPLGIVFIIYHWIKALMQKYQRSLKH